MSSYIMRLLVLFGAILTLGPVAAQSQSFQDDALTAALEYAEEQRKEVIAEKSEEAIKSLVKRLKGSTKNKALIKSLENTALSAEKIKRLSQDFGSGDTRKIEAAGQELALTMGGWLKDALKDPELKESMSELLGSADKINEVTEVLGSAVGGDTDGALEFVGSAIIEMSPAAGVVGAYQSAYAAMEYAHGKFIDAQMEDLYADFKSKGYSQERIKTLLQRPPYSHILRDKIIKQRQEQIEEFGDAMRFLPDRTLARLLLTTEAEVAAEIAAEFLSRAEKEDAEEIAAEAAKKGRDQAVKIFEWLDYYATEKWGEKWDNGRSYNLTKFAMGVRRALKADGTLKPDDPVDIGLMAAARSALLVFGRDSVEYEERLEKLQARRNFYNGVVATVDPKSFNGVYSATGISTDRETGKKLPAERATIHVNYPKFSLKWATALQGATGTLKEEDGKYTVTFSTKTHFSCEVDFEKNSLSARCKQYIDIFNSGDGSWYDSTITATKRESK